MIRLYILSVFILSFTSCHEESKNKIDDLVETNEKGVQEAKVDELSVEDVERLMKNSENPTHSYKAILNNDIEKPYYFQSDSSGNVKCLLSKKSDVVGLFLYKEVSKSVKVDSTRYLKVKDYVLIAESDTCSDKPKKPTNYKALVKLKRKFESKDSTADFTLNIFL